jgi:hypothetical protein
MTEFAVSGIRATSFALHPDSIVEIAVINGDEGGAIAGSWDTLLRPDDVGPTFTQLSR